MLAPVITPPLDQAASPSMPFFLSWEARHPVTQPHTLSEIEVSPEGEISHIQSVEGGRTFDQVPTGRLGQTVTYRIRTGYSPPSTPISWSPWSEPLRILFTINAPMLRPLPETSLFDEPIAFSWVSMNAFEPEHLARQVERSFDGGISWHHWLMIVGPLRPANQSSAVLTAGGVPGPQGSPGQTLMLRIRTSRSLYAPTWTPWSAPVSTLLVARGQAHIASPTSVWQSANLNVAINYAHPLQVGWRAMVLSLHREDRTIIEQVTLPPSPGYISSAIARFTQTLSAGVRYRLTGYVITTQGIRSEIPERTFLASFIAPVPPAISVTVDEDSAAADVRLYFAPGQAYPQLSPMTVSLWRVIDGVEFLVVDREPLTDNGLSICDPVPRSWGQTTYRAILFTTDIENGDIIASHPIEETIRLQDYRLHVNAGDELKTHFAIAANPSIRIDTGKPATLLTTAGRPRPIALVGREQHESLQISGTLIRGRWATVKEVEDTLREPTAAVVRVPDGRWLQGVIAGDINGWYGRNAQIQLTATSAGPGAGPLGERV